MAQALFLSLVFLIIRYIQTTEELVVGFLILLRSERRNVDLRGVAETLKLIRRER